MRELTFVRTGHLEWRDRPAPALSSPGRIPTGGGAPMTTSADSDVTIALCGDVTLRCGIDGVLAHPGKPDLVPWRPSRRTPSGSYPTASTVFGRPRPSWKSR